MLGFNLSWPLIQMQAQQAQSSSGLLLARKRKREGSNGETEEGERIGKIPRCTVVSQLCASAVIGQHVSGGCMHVQATQAIYICMNVIQRLKGERWGVNVT